MTEELLIECDPENGKMCEACNPPHGTEARYRIGDGTRAGSKNQLVACGCEPCRRAHVIWVNHTRWEQGKARREFSGIDDEPIRPEEVPILSQEWKRLGNCRPGTTFPCPTTLTNHEGCERCRGTGEVSASDLFFPGRGQDLRPAKKVCETCLVQKECLIWGTHYEDNGIWGGTGEKARVRFRERTGIKRQNLVEVFAGR
jgi:hypothetical protein